MFPTDVRHPLSAVCIGSSDPNSGTRALIVFNFHNAHADFAKFPLRLDMEVLWLAMGPRTKLISVDDVGGTHSKHPGDLLVRPEFRTVSHLTSLSALGLYR